MCIWTCTYVWISLYLYVFRHIKIYYHHCTYCLVLTYPHQRIGKCMLRATYHSTGTEPTSSLELPTQQTCSWSYKLRCEFVEFSKILTFVDNHFFKSYTTPIQKHASSINCFYAAPCQHYVGIKENYRTNRSHHFISFSVVCDMLFIVGWVYRGLNAASRA